MSEKYILACDSMTLLVKPFYFDFFTRSLVPMEHYWPIRPQEKCSDIVFAVHWGNNNTKKVSYNNITAPVSLETSNKIFFLFCYNSIFSLMFRFLEQFGNKRFNNIS